MKKDEKKNVKRLSAWFLQGLLFVAPIAVTIYAFMTLFMWIDAPLRTSLEKFELNVFPGIAFLIVVLTFVLVTIFVGFLSSNLITRGFMELLDRQFGRFPIVKLLHSLVKDVVGAFVGDEKKFEHPVMVCIVPGSNIRMVGFVTRESLEQLGLADSVPVYVPMAFNFGGNLLIVPRESVTPLNIPAPEVMTFAMSGGIAGSAKQALENSGQSAGNND